MRVSWKGIYFILTLFWGSFFGSIFMLGPFLPLMFISPSWYRWINNRLVATWLTLPVALLETLFGLKVILTGDAFVPGERSVIIMNHRTRMDWMFLWNCMMRYSYLRLGKVCLKASLKSVPGFGWAMQAAAYIFIHRKWKDDKSHFEDILDYFCDIREPLQLLIFPEGTDLTENSKARSNEFAEKNGLQKYEYVLHPRTTGFTFVVDRLREEMSAKRKSYSVEYKKGIVEDSWGQNLTVFCKEKMFSIRLVRKWRAEYGNFIEQVDKGNAKKRKCGSGLQPLFSELEVLICEWVVDRRAKALVVNRAQIQEFALAMAPQFDIAPEDFKASQHWLDNFLQRSELSLRRSTGTMFRLEDNQDIKRALAFKSFIDDADFSKYNLSNMIANSFIRNCSVYGPIISNNN
uniref:Lysocardiolipin acyltransferase 1 n=1 Tax=Pipistrellus kuhlii TaxID=59472 RepID=A0A7J7VV90_PIPKU|nr:lysocardiolipin acyltransferase 1 [Pipistrellus kuhlii]